MTHHSSLESSIKINTDLNLVSVHELFEHTQDVFNLIARRAFEMFEARGCVHGNDREDCFSRNPSSLPREVPPLGVRRTAYRTRRTSWIPQAGDQGESRAAPLSISGKTEPLENQKSENIPFA